MYILEIPQLQFQINFHPLNSKGLITVIHMYICAHSELGCVLICVEQKMHLTMSTPKSNPKCYKRRKIFFIRTSQMLAQRKNFYTVFYCILCCSQV